MDPLICARCKGKNPKLCNRSYCPIIAKIKESFPKIETSFEGYSNDIFVGRFNYPFVFAGALASRTKEINFPEEWFRKRYSIDEILSLRARFVYPRLKTDVKIKKNVINNIQEISATKKIAEVDIELKKKPKVMFNANSFTPIIANPAPLKRIEVVGNVKIPRKVDYFARDPYVKAEDAIFELYKKEYMNSYLINIFSAGILGLKRQRKLVPSRWATTAVDDIIARRLLKEIKHYEAINEYLLFYDEYLGNHYEIIFMPGKWSFEVIEAKMQGSVWNPSKNNFFVNDYEGFFGRKSYAENVTGAYYANKLAVLEYLGKIKKQASVLVLREVRPSYYAPCGVGILREVTRNALNKKPLRFDNFDELIKNVDSRLILNVKDFLKVSWLVKEMKVQKKLTNF